MPWSWAFPAEIREAKRREPRMNIFRLYARVLSLLGSEGPLAWILALANLALASAQFAEPVLLGRIIDTLTGAQMRGGRPEVTPDGAACRMGGFRTFHHRVRDVDRSLRRSPRAPAAPRRFDELFRARSAASSLLPRQYAFRPSDEDDAAWHGSVVGTVGRILPRQPLIAYFIARPVAGFAVY